MIINLVVLEDMLKLGKKKKTSCKEEEKKNSIHSYLGLYKKIVDVAFAKLTDTTALMAYNLRFGNTLTESIRARVVTTSSSTISVGEEVELIAQVPSNCCAFGQLNLAVLEATRAFL